MQMFVRTTGLRFLFLALSVGPRAAAGQDLFGGGRRPRVRPARGIAGLQTLSGPASEGAQNHGRRGARQSVTCCSGLAKSRRQVPRGTAGLFRDRPAASHGRPFARQTGPGPAPERKRHTASRMKLTAVLRAASRPQLRAGTDRRPANGRQPRWAMHGCGGGGAPRGSGGGGAPRGTAGAGRRPELVAGGMRAESGHASSCWSPSGAYLPEKLAQESNRDWHRPHRWEGVRLAELLGAAPGPGGHLQLRSAH